MTDVVRSVREVEEVTYTVSPETVRKAIMAELYDNHGGVFTPDTTITLCEDGSAIVSTPYEKEASF